MNKEPEMNNLDPTEVTPPPESAEESIEATDEAQENHEESKCIPSSGEEKPNEDEKSGKKSVIRILL